MFSAWSSKLPHVARALGRCSDIFNEKNMGGRSWWIDRFSMLEITCASRFCSSPKLQKYYLLGSDIWIIVQNLYEEVFFPSVKLRHMKSRFLSAWLESFFARYQWRILWCARSASSRRSTPTRVKFSSVIAATVSAANARTGSQRVYAQSYVFSNFKLDTDFVLTL